MPIQVICPGCHKRFKVSDQFAGQAGACPSCKGEIKVPEKSDEVQVHGHDEFAEGGRGVDGKLVTKPVARSVTKFNPVVATIIAAVCLVVLIGAFLGGNAIENSTLIRAVALFVISPPLALAGYTFLRNDELEPYRGQSLYLRSATCGAAWFALWCVFVFLVQQEFITTDAWTWGIVCIPIIVVGTMIPSALFDLDVGNGFFHYSFYVVVTLALRWVAGMPWIWELPSSGPVVPGV